MEQQNAKTFLMRLKKLDKLIENKKIEIMQLKSQAMGTSARIGGERVQASASQQRMADAVEEYVDLENQLRSMILGYEREKQKIISVIEQLGATDYDVLHKIYVRNLTFDEIATLYDKTYSWSTTVHGRAMNALQRLLEDGDRREENG